MIIDLEDAVKGSERNKIIENLIPVVINHEVIEKPHLERAKTILKKMKHNETK